MKVRVEQFNAIYNDYKDYPNITEFQVDQFGTIHLFTSPIDVTSFTKKEYAHAFVIEEEPEDEEQGIFRVGLDTEPVRYGKLVFGKHPMTVAETFFNELDNQQKMLAQWHNIVVVDFQAVGEVIYKVSRTQHGWMIQPLTERSYIILRND